jgi:hypothetical protein
MKRKVYGYQCYDSLWDAMMYCNSHQEWNIINIYPTGWRQEVCVVYYTIEE